MADEEELPLAVKAIGAFWAGGALVAAPALLILPASVIALSWAKKAWDKKQFPKKVARIAKETEENWRREQEQAQRVEVERQEAVIRQENERQRIVNLADLDKLRGLGPFQFETEMAAMYRRLGSQVTQTPQTNDGGRDGIMRKNGKLYLLERKRYDSATVGRPDLQKFMGRSRGTMPILDSLSRRGN